MPNTDDPPIPLVRVLALVATQGLGSALGVGLADYDLVTLTLFTAPAGLTAALLLLWMDHDLHNRWSRTIVVPCVAVLLAGMLSGLAGIPGIGVTTMVANWLPVVAAMCLGWPSFRNEFDPGPA